MSTDNKIEVSKDTLEVLIEFASEADIWEHLFDIDDDLVISFFKELDYIEDKIFEGRTHLCKWFPTKQVIAKMKPDKDDDYY